ncbi:inosine/xanthosine triphosphatase [Glaciecola sp. XM2]|jgi:inosine/xanthosine triphosphatase|uniref:inosine/xanthosine triphosphatase n=1 Tax=Glaciecola sp. XM2 TaxID=1914931 RepID=UPI001BDED3F4|nr:inosine/xanthosine triphosphatase [Glaciecola sp. XM2]MBT1451402.1 inosine/xanthosine triphosphatase [Glaciecola sp. XM2]
MNNEKTGPLTVAVASHNPVKVEAARQAFSAVFPQCDIKIVEVDADSGVPDQPMSYEQTREGAHNRVVNSYETPADYYIAYEGGVDVFEDGPKTFAVVCISDQDSLVYGQTASLPLPLSIYQSLLEGLELGDAMDALFNTHNIKQKGGAIGQLTQGIETRLSIYQSATVLALSVFAQPHLYDVSEVSMPLKMH